jgi:hypothetical protein
MTQLRCVAVLALLLLAAAGCASPPNEEEQIWEQVKIGDIAPPAEDRPRAQFLATAHLDAYTIEVPADNVDQLDDVWEALSAEPIRMNSYSAFTENNFRVRFGRVAQWPQIQNLLAEVGGQKAATTSIVLTDNETSDLPIVELPAARAISFVGLNLSQQTVNVGPGMLALRFRPEPIPMARGVRKVIAYPVYMLPVTSAIPEFQAQTRAHEFYFAPAAFAAQMGPGDLLVLGPDKHTGERLTLGGLFFNNPEGRLFFNPLTRKPPARKPAVRLYVLLCTRISH